MDPFRVDGEIALITGGGTGLGLAMAKCLAQAGAQVILAGRRESVLREAAREIGEKAYSATFDVAAGDAHALIADLSARIGAPTILINNAGNHFKKPALEISPAEFASVTDTHVKGAFALTQAAAVGMLERGKGSILFIASMASLFGIPQVAAYSAAKSAIMGLVRSLAVEFSPRGVRVNAIAPGFIETEISRRAFDDDPQRLRKAMDRTPMGRRGLPEDIGFAALYLCSPAAKYVTGIVLPVDGGTSIGF
ncbi:MAG: SDR family NAD(P)-dependent oxidoreductase [Candidatus Omnitrophota bacterium]